MLMLVLLMNLSSYLHTVLHIQIAPEVFCIAQHDHTQTPHLESSALPLQNNEHCSVCEYHLRNSLFDIEDNIFIISVEKISTETVCIYSFSASPVFYTSTRGPPAV